MFLFWTCAEIWGKMTMLNTPRSLCDRYFSVPRQSPTPKQPQLARQALLILGILFLLFFAVKYGRNMLRYRHLQGEAAIMDQHIAQVETEKKDVDRAFDDSLAPAVVEDFAHQLGWGRPDEKIIIPVGADANAATSTTEAEAAAAATQARKANWQLWLALLQDGS